MEKLKPLIWLILACTLTGAGCVLGEYWYGFTLKNKTDNKIHYQSIHKESDSRFNTEGELSSGEDGTSLFRPSPRMTGPFYDSLKKLVLTKPGECSLEIPADELRSWVEGSRGGWYIRLTEERLECPDGGNPNT